MLMVSVSSRIDIRGLFGNSKDSKAVFVMISPTNVHHGHG